MSLVTERVATYRRLLPRLVLGRNVYTRGTVTVYAREPFDTLCDVTFRLVDATGRTHAERAEMLAPDSPPIGLGGVVNLPPGRYEVIATPPLTQFWGDVPVEHRMPLTVAAPLQAPDPAAPEGPADVVARVADVRAALAPSADSRAAWLRLLDVAAGDPGRGFAARVRDAVAGTAPADAAALARDWPGAGCAGGIDVAAPDLHARLVALAALAATQGGDLADWAAAQIDAHAVALALASVDGLPISWPPAPVAAADPHAGLSWLLWGRGIADPTAPVVQALALAGYVPTPVPGRVALAAGPLDVCLAPRGGDALSLHRDGALGVAASGGSWLVALAADVRIAGTGATAVSRNGTALRARLPADAAVALPLWALEDLRMEDDLVAGRYGNRAFSLASTAALRRDPAAPEAAVLAAGPAHLACVAGAAGEPLDEVARDQARQPWPAAAQAAAHAIDSPFCRASADATHLTIRIGDATLSLDLSAPRGAVEGVSP